MTEWGNLALVDTNDDDPRNNTQIQLPGVVKGDFSVRRYKPEIQIHCIRFSPTMQSWCACTTEGLLLYSIDANLIFNPFNLSINITPKLVHHLLFVEKNYSLALIYSLNLNEGLLCQLVFESIPHDTIDIVINTLNHEYIDKLLTLIASRLDNTKHIDFYLIWLLDVLYKNASRLRFNLVKHVAIMCSLEKSLTKLSDSLNSM